MMVSKVAVMALVAVIAVPILLGYAMNLSEQTVTEYKPDGDSVNVTPLLQSGTEYTSAKADVHKLNTGFETTVGLETQPIYESYSTTNTSLQLNYHTFTLAPGAWTFFRFNQIESDFYLYADKSAKLTVNDLANGGNTTLHTATNVYAVKYWHDDHIVQYQTSSSLSYYTVDDPTSDWFFFSNQGTSDVTCYYWVNFSTDTNTYVDLAAGFHYISNYDIKHKMPDETKSAMITVNLDSITDSNYSVRYSLGAVSYLLEKTTTSGTVSWTATVQQPKILNPGYDDVEEIDLYYNQSGNNVYQFFVSAAPQGTVIRHPGTPYEETYYVVDWHSEIRYVGAWPTLIGTANAYLSYVNDITRESPNNTNTIANLGINIISGSRTPTTRVDSAEFRAFAYSIITDETYAPADFKTNPSTTLNVSKAGSSLEFGGNTYTVDSTGNITLGTHKVSVNGLKLESLPTVGGYENKINGTTISVTVDPSTIRFNGNWGASVSTVANAASSYTHTEWTAGEFGWDGIDHNFLIVGLLTSLGAFIALGIYIRRTKAALWPLLIVCGGAAMLFFCML